MTEFLSSLLDLSVLVFAVASMLSVGFRYTARQILGPLRNARAVFRTLVANFVLVPLWALAVLRMFPLEEPLAIGLFLVAAAAGAPFLIKLTEAAAGNVAISATLLVILVPATIVYLPLVVPLALPEAAVSVGAIATPLVLSMLLPLAAGLLVRARSRHWAERLRPLASATSTVTLIVLIAAIFLVNFEGILQIFGTGALLAILLVIGGAFAIGWLVVGGVSNNREEVGLATSQRNIAAATVVATQAIGDPDALAMVVVASLVGFALLFPVAAVLRRRERQHAEDEHAK